MRHVDKDSLDEQGDTKKVNKLIQGLAVKNSVSRESVNDRQEEGERLRSRRIFREADRRFHLRLGSIFKA